MKLAYSLLIAVMLPLAADATTVTQYYHVKSGTGFFVNRQYVVTNAHVVTGCSTVTIKGAVDEQEAQVQFADTEHDLAILLTNAPPREIAPLRFNIGSLHAGDMVYIIGYPGENGISGQQKMVQGEVQDVAPSVAGQQPGQFYISDVVDHGNSGGPVLDASGNVIGVVVAKTTIDTIDPTTQAKISEQHMGVVISLETLKQFLVDHGAYFVWTESGLLFNNSYIEDRAKNYLVNVQCRQPDGPPVVQ